MHQLFLSKAMLSSNSLNFVPFSLRYFDSIKILLNTSPLLGVCRNLTWSLLFNRSIHLQSNSSIEALSSCNWLFGIFFICIFPATIRFFCPGICVQGLSRTCDCGRARVERRYSWCCRRFGTDTNRYKVSPEVCIGRGASALE